MTLIERGRALLERISAVQNMDLLAKILSDIGNIASPHLNTQKWRETAVAAINAGVDALVGPAKKLYEDYIEWYTDCKILFAKKGWNRSRAVKIFDDVPHLVTIDSIGTRVQMIVKRQIEMLEDLSEKPPRTWSFARAAVLVIYASACVFVDTILSILFGLAVVPVAAFEVGLVLAFPKLEEWIVG